MSVKYAYKNMISYWINNNDIGPQFFYHQGRTMFSLGNPRSFAKDPQGISEMYQKLETHIRPTTNDSANVARTCIESVRDVLTNEQQATTWSDNTRKNIQSMANGFTKFLEQLDQTTEIQRQILLNKGYTRS